MMRASFLAAAVLLVASSAAHAADEFAYYLHLADPPVPVASGGTANLVLDTTPPIKPDVERLERRIGFGERAVWGPFVSAPAPAAHPADYSA
jgi:hypothetical protein